MQNKPRKSCTRSAENKSLFPIPSTHPSNHPPFSTIPIIVLIFQQLSPRFYLRIFYDTFMINRVTTQLRQSNHYRSQLFFISQITVCKFVVRIAYFFFIAAVFFNHFRSRRYLRQKYSILYCIRNKLRSISTIASRISAGKPRTLIFQGYSSIRDTYTDTNKLKIWIFDV